MGGNGAGELGPFRHGRVLPAPLPALLSIAWIPASGAGMTAGSLARCITLFAISRGAGRSRCSSSCAVRERASGEHLLLGSRHRLAEAQEVPVTIDRAELLVAPGFLVEVPAPRDDAER